MWTRAQLKKEAKARLITFYWKALLISFIVITFAEGGGFTGGYNINNFKEFRSEANYDSLSLSGLPYRFSEIPASIIYMVLGIIIFITVLAGLYQIFVANMLIINEMRFYLCSREYKASLGEIAYAFGNGNYLKSVGTMFCRDLFTTLWSLLFIIPGIVKSYEYRMIPYLLAENPQLDLKRAFQLSKEMMEGQKWETFVLELSFILWHLLGLVTCIGGYFVRPYIQATRVELYTVLKEISINKGITSQFELSGFLPNN